MTPPMCMSPFTRRRFSTLRSVTNMRSSQLPSLTRLCVNMLGDGVEGQLSKLVGWWSQVTQDVDSKWHRRTGTHDQRSTVKRGQFVAQAITRQWQQNDEWTEESSGVVRRRRRLANISSLGSLFSCCCFLGIDSFPTNIVGVRRCSEE